MDKFRVVRSYYNEEVMKDYVSTIARGLTIEEAEELKEICASETRIKGVKFYIWKED